MVSVGIKVNSSYGNQLIFIRDAQRAGLINNETKLKGFIVSELGDMELDAEVKPVKNLNW